MVGNEYSIRIYKPLNMSIGNEKSGNVNDHLKSQTVSKHAVKKKITFRNFF